LRLSPWVYLDLWRHGPPGRRSEFVRRVRDLVDRPPPDQPRYLDVGEFQNWEQFEIKYRQLAEELGRSGQVPAPGEVDFLHRMVDLDRVRYPGAIGSRDYFFLTCLVSILAPRRVIEIGTLTGFSSAIIAAAIHRQHGSQAGITVDTIDAHTHCSIDPTRPIGFEIAELIPDLVPTVRVHKGRESDVVPEIAAPGEFGLAFIDADHRHPWPLLDVLRLAPYVQAGGWVSLHDIHLGTYGKAERAAGRTIDGTPYGAEWLFESWPFRKIRSLHIGAIELPQEKAALVPVALALMEKPFEITGKTAKRIRGALYDSLVPLAPR
jgi:predicted O-methyltransferase YrrM